MEIQASDFPRYRDAVLCVPTSISRYSTWDFVNYRFHYIADEPVEKFLSSLCEECEEIVYDDTCNCSDCPVGFEPAEPGCLRRYLIDAYLPFLITADILLRNTLGDAFADSRPVFHCRDDECPYVE